MSWSDNENNNGGPWGGGGQRNKPTDIDQLLKEGGDKFRSFFSNSGGPRGFLLISLIVLVVYAATGIYRVMSDEEGVVLRFGQVVRTTTEGLHYHLPSPIEYVYKPKITRINTISIGFRSTTQHFSSASMTDVPEESNMLTGDENIIHLNAVVFWRIKDAQKYMFNVRNIESTIKIAAESVIREVIGRTTFESAYTESRGLVQTETKRLLQAIMDEYNSGIEITEAKLLKADYPENVIEAAIEVQRAKADKDRLINEGEAYKNDIVPKARGDAEKKLQDAAAYKEKKLLAAQGDTQRFSAIYEAYKVDPSVTKKRLQLEMAEEVYGKAQQKIIMDTPKAMQGVLPHMALPALKQGSKDQSKDKVEQGESQ